MMLGIPVLEGPSNTGLSLSSSLQKCGVRFGSFAAPLLTSTLLAPCTLPSPASLYTYFVNINMFRAEI